MKKLFWVNLLLIINFSLVSCASLLTNNSEIVDSALILANKQTQLNQLEDALNTYDEALKHGYDYKLLYNKAITQSKLNDYDGAIKTAEICYKKYNNPETLLLLGKLYYLNNNIEKFIDSFSKYFNEKPNDNDSMIQFIILCSEKELSDMAYQKALFLWDKNVFKNEVIEVLYKYNPDEWKIVKTLFN